MWAWLAKLFSGIVPGLKDPKDYFGKIIWFGFWFMIFTGVVYFGKKGVDRLFPPAPIKVTQVQSGGTALEVSHNYPKVGFGGCANVKVYEYYKEKK